MNKSQLLNEAVNYLTLAEEMPDEDLERLRAELAADVGELRDEYQSRHVEEPDPDTEDVGELFD